MFPKKFSIGKYCDSAVPACNYIIVVLIKSLKRIRVFLLFDLCGGNHLRIYIDKHFFVFWCHFQPTQLDKITYMCSCCHLFLLFFSDMVSSFICLVIIILFLQRPQFEMEWELLCLVEPGCQWVLPGVYALFCRINCFGARYLQKLIAWTINRSAQEHKSSQHFGSNLYMLGADCLNYLQGQLGRWRSVHLGK